MKQFRRNRDRVVRSAVSENNENTMDVWTAVREQMLPRVVKGLSYQFSYSKWGHIMQGVECLIPGVIKGTHCRCFWCVQNHSDICVHVREVAQYKLDDANYFLDLLKGRRSVYHEHQVYHGLLEHCKEQNDTM